MNLEGSEYLCPIDPLEYESWPLLQNIEELTVTQYSISENAISNCEPPALDTVENGGGGGGAAAAAPQVVQPQSRRLNRQNKSNSSKKINKKCSPENESIKNQKILVEEQSSDEEGTLVAKKMNHNAKERIRRLKLNASYLALRALLPDYSRSRSKRWSAPAIVDRVLKYIPDLENEIETLKLKKQNYITQSGESTEISPDQNSQRTGSGTTVSVNEIKEGEAIIQICMENRNEFTKLLQKVEDEQGICIQSASTLQVSQNRICYHLHIQTSENSILANYVEGLRDKVFSWLR